MINERISAVSAKQNEIDLGLRDYMLKVYNYMAGGLIATALTVYFLISTGAIMSFFTITETSASLSLLGWVALLAPLGLVLYFGHAVARGSLSQVKTVFWIYSVLMGASIAPIMLIYTGESVARVFLITAAMFGGMSIYGYTTKRDLTSMGSFLFMGLIGLIIASIVNIFWASSALFFAVSVAGVAIFVGLTAYDVQKIRNMYVENDEDMSGRYAIYGALNLYMDFINLFLYMLRLLGNRR